MAAKPIYDLSRKILDLMYDSATSKLPQFLINSNQPKKFIDNELVILKAYFKNLFIYLKGYIIIIF